VHEPPILIRDREAADLDACVQALEAVYQEAGYPTNWPADPARWLTPPGICCAWIAATSELPVAGHVILRQLPAGASGERAAEVSRLFVVPAAHRLGIGLALLAQATAWTLANELDLVLEVTDHLRAARALYERAGFRLLHTGPADWTGPDGQPVTMLRFARSREAGPLPALPGG
jgi:GNAT superfamily N-acetyltransferase